MNCLNIETDEMLTAKDADPHLEDIGPAPKQGHTTGDSVEYFDCIDDRAPGVLSPGDANIEEVLKKAVEKNTSQDDVVVDWPSVSNKAVSIFNFLQ